MPPELLLLTKGKRGQAARKACVCVGGGGGRPKPACGGARWGLPGKEAARAVPGPRGKRTGVCVCGGGKGLRKLADGQSRRSGHKRRQRGGQGAATGPAGDGRPGGHRGLARPRGRSARESPRQETPLPPARYPWEGEGPSASSAGPGAPGDEGSDPARLASVGSSDATRVRPAVAKGRPLLGRARGWGGACARRSHCPDVAGGGAAAIFARRAARADRG